MCTPLTSVDAMNAGGPSQPSQPDMDTKATTSHLSQPDMIIAAQRAPANSSSNSSNGHLSRAATVMVSADSSYAPSSSSSSLDDLSEKQKQQLDSFTLAKSKLNASLDEANSSVAYPRMDAPFWKKLCAFSGLGLMVSVGYFDPGAT